MKIAEMYFPVHWALLIMLYKVVLAIESVYEVLKCAHFNESYWQVISSDYSIIRTDQQSHFSPHKK